MPDRPPRDGRWRDALIGITIAVITGLLARYGIVVPPPVIPPIVVPPPAPQPGPGEGTLDPTRAIGRLALGRVGCTATVIGPRRADGRWWVLSAAHCTTAVGQRGTLRLPDGRQLGVVVASRDPRSDACWLLSESVGEAYPHALLADADPAPGTPVWHAGYGVDRPGNREDGAVAAGPDDRGQLRFRLSVSSGDSGGAIITDADGRVVSAVCCTSAPGRVADVWGPSVASIRRAQLDHTTDEPWEPLPIPVRQ